MKLQTAIRLLKGDERIKPSRLLSMNGMIADATQAVKKMVDIHDPGYVIASSSLCRELWDSSANVCLREGCQKAERLQTRPSLKCTISHFLLL